MFEEAVSSTTSSLKVLDFFIFLSFLMRFFFAIVEGTQNVLPANYQRLNNLSSLLFTRALHSRFIFLPKWMLHVSVSFFFVSLISCVFSGTRTSTAFQVTSRSCLHLLSFVAILVVVLSLFFLHANRFELKLKFYFAAVGEVWGSKERSFCGNIFFEKFAFYHFMFKFLWD